MGHVSTKRYMHGRSQDVDEQRSRFCGVGIHDDFGQNRRRQFYDAHLHDKVIYLYHPFIHSISYPIIYSFLLSLSLLNNLVFSLFFARLSTDENRGKYAYDLLKMSYIH